MELFEYTKKTIDTSFLSQFNRVESRFSLPSQSCDFGSKYLFFIITPCDVQILHKYARGVILFPDALNLTISPSFLRRQPFVPTLVRLFPGIATVRDRSAPLFPQMPPHSDFDIPHFARRFHALEQLADDSGCLPIDFLLGTPDRRIRDFSSESIVISAPGERCRISFREFALSRCAQALSKHFCEYETFVCHLTHLSLLNRYPADLTAHVSLSEFPCTRDLPPSSWLPVLLHHLRTPAGRRMAYLRARWRRLRRPFTFLSPPISPLDSE
jgi:hypothetical protein